MRKDAHFGATSIIKVENYDILEVLDFVNEQSLNIYDAEIIDQENSPEVVSIAVCDADEKKSEIFIHKKDCLQIALFLLNIHTGYANRSNELDFEDFKNQFDNI